MTRNYRTIQEIAKDEQIGELHVWAAIRGKGVRSRISEGLQLVVIDNAEWQEFAQSAGGGDFLAEARKLAEKYYE